MQNQIDQLTRQELSLRMLASILGNQINGIPDGKILRLQNELLMKASVETMAIKQEIDHLIAARDQVSAAIKDS